jgi:hypothetical protein
MDLACDQALRWEPARRLMGFTIPMPPPEPW